MIKGVVNFIEKDFNILVKKDLNGQRGKSLYIYNKVKLIDFLI